MYYHSWTPLCRTRLSRTPRYLEQNRISLGFAPVFSLIYYGLFRTRLSRTPRYLEQTRISLGFAPVYSVIYYGLSRTRLSRTPRYLELFLAPLSSNQPRLSQLYYGPKKHWSTSVRKCSQGTSWQDVLKAEKCIDVFTVTKAKSDWLDLPLRMQKTTSSR